MPGIDFPYSGGGGGGYVGVLARPEKANGAGVLMAHGGAGLGVHERDAAGRLAARGYTVLVADWIGAGGARPREDINALVGAALNDPRALRAPMSDGLAALAALPGVDAARIAVVGYCLGGAAAFELARAGADVQAVIGFHATLPIDHPEDCRAIRGKVLMLHGALDPLVPDASRIQFEKNLSAAGVDWRIVVYGGAQHGFTMRDAETFGRPGIAYDRRADERSWRAMLDLFAETIDR